MKRYLALVIILLSLVYMSCQKEIDWGLGGTGSNNLLSRINSKTGTDSSEVSYFYNTQNRLIREKTTGISGGLTLDNELIKTGMLLVSFLQLYKRQQHWQLQVLIVLLPGIIIILQHQGTLHQFFL